jgi:DNA sulfur modification protein DndC
MGSWQTQRGQDGSRRPRIAGDANDGASGHELSQQSQQHVAIESARYWLNEAILKLPQGQSQRYQEMAKRGQYFNRVAERLNLTPAEFDRYLVAQAIPDAEHSKLLDARAPDLFSDLFSLAA